MKQTTFLLAARLRLNFLVIFKIIALMIFRLPTYFAFKFINSNQCSMTVIIQ